MSFKSKAEQQFELKFALAMEQRDFELMEKVINQYGCYLELLEPLPEWYGLPVCFCDEVPPSEEHEDHVWTDDTGIKMWCAWPKTAGQIIEGQNTESAIRARVDAAFDQALKGPS